MSAAATPDAAGIQAGLGALLDGDYLYQNSPAMQRLSLALYRLLAKGSPVPPAALAAASGQAAAEVADLLHQVPASVIEVDTAGSVVAFAGLTLAPTRHTLTVAGRTLYTWCAFDALFLPEILAAPARIISTCPATGRVIDLALGPSGLSAGAAPAAVMSIVVPDLDDCRDDLRGAFCCHVNFFADAAAFDAWRVGAGPVARLSIGDALDLARARNAARYKDIGLAET